MSPILISAFLAGVVLFALASQQAAAITKCADVMFIGARGSGELEQAQTDGMGVPVDYMGQQLAKLVNAYQESFAFRQVPYNADSVEELKPSSAEIDAMKAAGGLGLGDPAAGVAGLSGAAAIYYARHAKPYLASVGDGVVKTVGRVKQLVGACPEAELILAGYSQGAMAVHQAELQLEREGDEEAIDAIGGTLLLGDGDRTPNTQAKLIGGAPRTGEGVRVYLHGIKGLDVAEPETTAEICVPNDIVCDFSLHYDRSWYSQGAHIHSAYKDPPQRHYLDVAVKWIAREMGLIG